jgi:L,D-peptidoglycan transpeptidase YkuD (ErfK/YbiS/YcfS/YnhG family)
MPTAKLSRSIAFALALVPFAAGADQRTTSDYLGIHGAIARSRQLVVVAGRGWSDDHATVALYERHWNNKGRQQQRGTWKRVSPELPVMLGRNGLAWGVGLHRRDPTKREGDGCSPAGVFTLQCILGRDPATPSLNFPYQQLSATMAGIDDPDLRFYNRLIDLRQVTAHEWTHEQKVRPQDPMFRWCVEVGQNSQQLPGFGSCVYLHIWRAPGVATSGCTAMSEGTMDHIVRWLDARKRPLLVQLPQAELAKAGIGLSPRNE